MASRRSNTATAPAQTVTPIKVVCPKCEADRVITGVSWEDISAVADEAFAMEGLELAHTPTITRKCSQCSYRERRAQLPLTEEQKDKRREYNKRRREEIKQALDFMRSQQSGSDTDDEDGE